MIHLTEWHRNYRYVEISPVAAIQQVLLRVRMMMICGADDDHNDVYEKDSDDN